MNQNKASRANISDSLMQRKRLLTFFMGFILLVIVVGNVWMGILLQQVSEVRAEIRDDYSYINSIDFGLLSVNVWRDDIQFILSKKINEFTFTPEQEEKLKAEISKVLHQLIDEAILMIERQETFGGKLRKVAINTLVDWDELRANVPEFTQTIIDEVKTPESREKMNNLIQEKLDEYATQTYGSVGDTAYFNNLLLKYECKLVNEFNANAAILTAALQERAYRLTFLMLASILVFLLLWFFVSPRKELHQLLFVFSVALALVVLIVSLTSPMIEIDARIHKLDFVLLGEHLEFNDQVLFYQSKSIIDVVKILIRTEKADSIFVGILLLIFSVIFPVTKLVCTDLYLLGKQKVKNNRLVKFFAFYSGKWSMADVMVVAIFMSYVGFNGILDDQLSYLNVESESYTTIATNLTSLQPAFILFVAFVIFGLVLSEILKSITIPEKEKIKPDLTLSK